jgi:ABC-type nitrate/sulfonate/bicarbonate transport system ATPase subunit
VLTQASGLLGHLTVMQNVQLAGHLRRRAGGGGGPSPDELLQGLGLSAVIRSRPQTLSGGPEVPTYCLRTSRRQRSAQPKSERSSPCYAIGDRPSVPRC